MKSYYSYLKSIQSPVNFKRKINYLKYNFGKDLNIIPKNSNVLEIGPGIGEFISLLNSNGIKNIVCVDNDKEVLNYLSANYKIKKTIHTNNLLSIDTKLTKYKIIFMLQVLEHIPKDQYKKLIEMLYKHLEKNGKIIITIPNGTNFININEMYSDITHVTLFTPNSIKQLYNMCDLPKSSLEIKGYKIPPYDVLNIIRIIFQKFLHILIKITLIVNGGTGSEMYYPNISFIITKKD